MDEEILTLTQEQLAELKKRFMHSSVLEEKSYVRISEDRMEGYLYLAEPSEERSNYTVDELKELLMEEGVMDGYLEHRLKAMAKKGVYQREILVARGKPVIEGEDGHFELFFTPDEVMKSPTIRPDGSVDYTSVTMLQSVKAGDKLAVYHSAVAGEDGYNVLGRTLKCKVVKELRPLRGRSVRKDGDEYFATNAGKIELKNGQIDIRSVHEIPGDVNTSNGGRLEFFGDIVIGGSVGTGCIIRAGRNLIVSGVVEGADIFAGGDIVLKRGIQGNSKGQVRCRGNLHANFIEQCEVSSESDINANYILNANISAGGKVIVNGVKGSIIGGRTSGLKGVDVCTVGNESEVPTIIHSGYEREVFDLYAAAVEKEKEIKEKLQDVLEKMTILIKKKQFQGGASGNTLQLLNEKKDEYFKQLDTVGADIEHYLQRIEKGKHSKINIYGTMYGGTVVSIEDCNKHFSGIMQYSTFKCIKGEIVSETYSGDLPNQS